MKHFNAVSTTEFSDGQAFYDILKVSDNSEVGGELLSNLQISAFYPVLSTFFQRTPRFYTVSVLIFTTEFLSVSTVQQMCESSNSRRPYLSTRNVVL
jgi:hypothetical protein